MRSVASGQHSTAIARGTRLRNQKNNVEEPAAERRYSCSRIGPSSGSQDLLNTSDLLIAADDTLAHFCALELALNSTGNVRKANKEDDPKRMTPAQVRYESCSINPATNNQGAILDASCTTGTM